MEFISMYTSAAGTILFYLMLLFVFLTIAVAPATFLTGIVSIFLKEGEETCNRNIIIQITTMVISIVLMVPIAISAIAELDGVHQGRIVKAEELKANPEVSGLPRIERFIVVKRNPPKHFYVTLKSIETNTVYDTTYVSKHCNNHSQIADGEEVNVKVYDVWRKNAPDQKRIVFTNLYQVFCE